MLEYLGEMFPSKIFEEPQRKFKHYPGRRQQLENGKLSLQALIEISVSDFEPCKFPGSLFMPSQFMW